MNKKILDSVFKAYDVRGRYPEELSPGFFYNLGKAYATHFKPEKVVVGHDIRDESLELMHKLIDGLVEMGTDVVNLGEIATEMIYFATGEYASIYDGGMIVTASHNPSGWNGCKMVKKDARAVSKDSGLLELKKIMLDGSYEKVKDGKGEINELDIYPAFKEKVLSFITTENRPDVDVVVDAGNGIGGKVFDYIFGDLGLDIKRMYFNPDGTFPNHVPNPALEANVVDLKEEVLSGPYDFGIAIDGDADRVFFIDKKGRKPDGVFTGLILFEELARHSDNKKLVHDPRSMFPYKEEAKKIGAETVQSKAGHSFFKQTMFKEDALFGAEMSSHFFYKDFYYADSGMISIAVMLDMFFEGYDLTKQVDMLMELYPKSGEVNYKVDHAQAMLDKLESHYRQKGAEIEKIDGISVNMGDWRFNLRKSNTEPLIRLNLEALDKRTVVEKFNEIERMIGAERENEPSLVELQEN